MKQIFTLVLIFLTINGFTQNFDNQGEYMGHIGKQQENVTKKYLSYSSAVAHGKRAKKVENLRSKLLDEVQEARMNIESMPSFKGDKSYRDSAVKFMRFYFTILNEDYSKIINLEEVAEKSYDDMEAYILAQEMIDKKMDEANTMMQKAQKEFAAKNNINLVDGKSELGEMSKKVHAISEYYHKAYLLFFKANFQEESLVQAIEKGNITGIEQAKGSLLKYAQEGLAKANELKPFDGDNSLVSTLKNTMNFYVKEASDKVQTASDYFLAKERFELVKKEMDKKGDNRTKEDVDNYNKAVKDINSSTDKFNKTNKELFELRNEIINNWNKATDEFYDTHTPRYK